MKIGTNSINKHLKKPLSTEEMVQALERTEVEVEEIISALELDKKVITARIVKITPHPNADRLRLVELDTGNSKVAVVCGAPNVAEDQVVALAQVGAVLPDGTKIQRAEIRGEKSNGMLCSPKELGLGEDHSGIAVLDPVLPLGVSLCDIENSGDIVDIKTPANRWDMSSTWGLAREISANSQNGVLLEPKHTKIDFDNVEVVKVRETTQCQRFVSLRLKIDSAQSPAWLLDELQAAGIRPISAVVDITNYVLYELGQPSHAYDAAKLSGGLQVRFARKDEKLTTLDGVKRTLTPKDLVIADSKGAVGLAGIMGGKDTEVDENTTEIIVEIANFDKTTIRRSALRHGLRTEASARFERGLPLPLPHFAAERIMLLLKEICQAELVGAHDQLYGWPWVQYLGLRLRRAERFLGTKLDEKAIIDGLRARGFEAEHFSLGGEARQHLGKPYLYGASFKKNGEEAFDCSYLTERIYSQIGISIGHTAQQQFAAGEAVADNLLKAGDLLFYSGYWEELDAKQRGDIGHVGLYLGKNEVMEASQYEYDFAKKAYHKRKKGDVRIVSLDSYLKNPGYKGARRILPSFNHIIAVTAPWWRTDIRIEQDLYEEAAKIHGYENIGATLPQLPAMETGSHQLLLDAGRLRTDLLSRGCFELTTYSFVSEEDVSSTGAELGAHLRILNPLSREQAYLRSSLLASHLRVLAKNSDYQAGMVTAFEIARTYEKSSSADLGKHEAWRLGIVAHGKDAIAQVKSLVDMIITKYHLELSLAEIESSNVYIVGRSAMMRTSEGEIGAFGQIKPTVLRSFGIASEVAFAEIFLESLLELGKKQITAVPVPSYQFIERDITLELADSVWWQDLSVYLKAQPQVRKFEFVSEFHDASLEKKYRRKVSFRVWLDLGAQPKSQEITKTLDNLETGLLQAIETQSD